MKREVSPCCGVPMRPHYNCEATSECPSCGRCRTCGDPSVVTHPPAHLNGRSYYKQGSLFTGKATA